MTTSSKHSWVSYMDQRFYPEHQTGWDDKLYVEQIRTASRPTDHVLDLGCGRGANPRIVINQYVSRVCGVDLGEAVLENPHLNEAKSFDGTDIPYMDQSFDGVITSYVLEHLENPEEIFREVYRVLKPGGYFISRTPCRFHYVALIATITPHWFHEYINKKRGREVCDTFPTFYRANSPAEIKALAEQTGLVCEDMQTIDGRPEYMRFNALTYTVGLLYQRLVTQFQFLQAFRPLILCTLRKPE